MQASRTGPSSDVTHRARPVTAEPSGGRDGPDPDLGGAVMRALRHITATTAGARHPWEVADELVLAATVWVPGCQPACLVLRRSTGSAAPLRVSASDPLGDEVADILGGLAPGAWPAPRRGSDLVQVDDVRSAADPSATALRTSAARSVLGVQVGLGAAASRQPAALVLVSTSPGAFGPASQDLARLFATYAGVSVAAALEVEHLRVALASRDGISTAKGMLMGRYGVDGEQAFAILVRLSRDSNTRLADLAARLVADRAVDGLDAAAPEPVGPR